MSKGVELSLQTRAMAELERRRRMATNTAHETPYTLFQQQYAHDPARFVRECFYWKEGQGAASYQSDALSRLEQSKRLALRGPRGLGKSAFNAWALLWFALTRDGLDWKILTTAGSWRQLEKYLWPEVHKWIRRLNWNIIGRAPFRSDVEQMSRGLRLNTGEAIAIASSDPALIEGAHADNVLFIFDEAKSIGEKIWDAAEGTFSSSGSDLGRESMVLATSTPGFPEGRFYDICQRAPGFKDWDTMHVTIGQCIEQGRISPAWVQSRLEQWGEGSPIYRSQVLGEFARGSSNGVIPIEWVEAAIERWYDWEDTNFRGKVTSLGLDCSEGGDNGDKSVLAICFDGFKISRLYNLAFQSQGTALMEAAGYVRSTYEQYGTGTIIVDATGIGAGVSARLMELGYPVIAFKAQLGTILTDMSGNYRFANWRAAGWWLFREMLDPANKFDICLPPDTDETSLLSDLIAPTSMISSNGRITIESKDSIRRRIGRSTDYADAVIQAITGPILQQAFEQEHYTEINVEFDRPRPGMDW